MKKKQILILCTLFFASLCVGIFISRKSTQTVPQEKPVVSPTPAPTPVLPLPLTTQKTTYRFSSLLNAAPKTLASYTVFPGQNLNALAVSLATSFGFSGSPAVVDSTRGKLMRWENGKKTLSFSEDKKTITYAAGLLLSPPKPITQPSLETAASSFLASLGAPHIPSDITLTSVQYFAPNQGNPNQQQSAEGATLFQLNYSYVLGGTPLYSEKLGSSPDVWVQLDSAGAIVACGATLIPKTEEKRAMSVVSEGEAAKALLGSGVGVFYTSLANASNELVLLSSPPTSVSVEKSSLVYYYSSKTNSVEPVYLFWGTGKTPDGVVKTLSVVPATTLSTTAP
jgi:hypothetical protein